MLETSRLSLRLAAISDAPLLMKLNSDPEVVRFVGEPATLTLIEAQNVIRDRLLVQFTRYKMGRFLTFLKDGTFIGWCGLRFFPETNEVDLGYRFIKTYWGKGYATEAARICLDYGFKTLKLERIIAKAMPENTASLKVMQKLGMTFKGVSHDPTEPCPLVVYEITKENFR